MGLEAEEVAEGTQTHLHTPKTKKWMFLTGGDR